MLSASAGNRQRQQEDADERDDRDDQAAGAAGQAGEQPVAEVTDRAEVELRFLRAGVGRRGRSARLRSRSGSRPARLSGSNGSSDEIFRGSSVPRAGSASRAAMVALGAAAPAPGSRRPPGPGPSGRSGGAVPSGLLIDGAPSAWVGWSGLLHGLRRPGPGPLRSRPLRSSPVRPNCSGSDEAKPRPSSDDSDRPGLASVLLRRQLIDWMAASTLVRISSGSGA